MLRTHDAGSLRATHAGQTVSLAGWVARRRDHGGVAFIDLRDSTGSVQVVIRDEVLAGSLRAEWCLQISGEVVLRPEGNANSTLPTGAMDGIRVLSINQDLYGQQVLPYAFELSSSVYYVKDDGIGNLIDYKNSNISRKLLTVL